MNIVEFLKSFPEIKGKDDKYYLFLGIVTELNTEQINKVLDFCLDQDVLKRKIIVKKTLSDSPNWPKKSNNALFKKLLDSLDTLDSYFKKESVSIILIGLCPYISRSNQQKILNRFLKSRYKNNRKRAYEYLMSNWSPEYQKAVEEAWREYNDLEIIELIVSRASKDFLLKNLNEISDIFDQEDLEYDFQLKILKNRFYSRIIKNITEELEELKKNDPISFIFIMKEGGEK